MTYANARYYNQDVGKFLSQDPVYLAIGNTDIIQGKTEKSQQELLKDPQLLNSYSYAKNNPIIIVDRDGEIAQLALIPVVGFIGGAGADYVGQVINNFNSGQSGLDAFRNVSGERVAAGAFNGAAISLVGLATGGNPFAIGGTAAALSVGTDVTFGEKVNVQNVVTEGALSGLTAGVLKGYPKVSGVHAGLSTKSSLINPTFFAGAHAQRIYLEEAINSTAQATVSAVGGLLNSVAGILKNDN